MDMNNIKSKIYKQINTFLNIEAKLIYQIKKNIKVKIEAKLKD